MSDGTVRDFKDALLVRNVVARSVQATDRSTNSTVVEYAVQTMMKKRKSPAAAAKDTAAKHNGSENMFFGPGVVEIDPKKLEEAIWDRMVDYAIKGMSKMKEGMGHFALDGTMDLFKQKTPSVRAELKKRVIQQLGNDPFANDNMVAKVAGPVVPFKPKPGVPTELIAGRKYVLSTDGGPLGDREDDKDHGWGGYGDGESGGARMIITPQTGPKFRYLWAYDVERQYLGMWRVTDGNEKFAGSARSETARIVKLEKKGQLNRVTHEEFRKVEREMRDRENDALNSLKKYIEDNKSDNAKKLDELVREFYEKHVEDKLQRALDAAERGAVPIGFKPFGPGETDPEWRKRQVASHVLGQVWRKEMALDKVEDYLRANGVDVEAAGQDVDWAIQDLFETAAEKLLPERPE